MKAVPLWRVFPWDPNAVESERFSIAFVPGGQGRGRFDLPGNPLGVVYLAGTEDHAIAEMIQGFRNSPHPLDDADLTAWGHTYALVDVTLDAGLWPRIADLCEPGILQDVGTTADHPPSRDRRKTQALARDLHQRGHAGLHWWSAFRGEWHTTVLFRDQLFPGAITYGTPIPLSVQHPAVAEAARLLDIG